MAAIRDAASSSSVRPHPYRVPATPDRRSQSRLALAAAILPLLSSAVAHADLYWDINGATANTGTAANGTWSATSTNWNTVASGTGGGATTWTPAGDRAIFSSGTGHTGNTSVTIVGTQTVTGIVFEEGSVSLTGPGALSFGANPITIQTTHTGNNAGNILIPILGSGDLTISNTSGGDATINLDGSMAGFTGNIIVGPGTSAAALTKLQLDSAPGDASKTITLNSFSELSNNNQVTLGDGTLTSTNYTIANPIVLAGTNAWIASANGPTGTQKIVTYAGAITGSGNLWIGIGNGGGRGTVVLGAQSSYAGDTYIVMANTNGLVQLGVDNALPSTTNLNFGAGTAGQTPNVAPFDFNGHNLTVASLSSDNSGTVPGLFNTSATPVTLTLNGAKNATFKGVIGSTATNLNPFNNNAPYLGTVNPQPNISLVKNGTGSQTLSAAGNNIPSITINGGTLSFTSTNAVNGALVGPSTVTVNSGGTLATGSGNVTLNATISAAGAIAPGNNGTIGNMVLSGGDLTFTSGSKLSLDFLNGGSFDTITSNANINLDSGPHFFDLNVPAGGSLTPGTYHIATANNVSWDGTNGFTAGTTPSNLYNYSLVPNGPYLDLLITPNSPVYRWSLAGSYPVFEGEGDWSDGSANFVDLSTNSPVTWSNSNTVDVIVGGDTVSGVGGTIHLTSNVVVNGKLTLAPVIAGYPYTIGDGPSHSLTLSPAANTPGIQADTSAILNAPVTLATSQTWTIAGSANVLTVNQPITAPSATLTKSGSGILLLNAAGSSFAGINLTAGTLGLGTADAAGAGPISIDSGATLGVTAAITLNNAISIGTGGAQILAGPTTAFPTAANLTVAGAVTASGTLIKNGSGVLTLTNAANSIPALTIRGGVGSAVSLASPSPITGTTLTLNNGGLTLTAPMTLPNNIVLNGRSDGNILDIGANAVTTTGVISADGNIYKYGSGTLTLSGVSTWTGGAFTVKTPSTVVLNSSSPLGSATIAIDALVTFDVPVDANTASWRSIASDFHKTGTGTLTVGATGAAIPTNNVPGFSAIIDQGAIRMNTPIALGGNTNADHMNIVVNPGTELIAAFSGPRLGGSITLAGGTITRAADAPTGEAVILQSYGSNVTSNNVNAFHNNILDVTASSTIRTLQQSVDTSSKNLAFEGSVVVRPGATLTLDNENAADFDENNLIAFRGPSTAALNPNDAFTISAGAKVITTGPGQVRFGRTSSQGKTIVATGTPGSEATLQIGSNTFLTERGAVPTTFAIQGSGNAGLRIEAAMNANYTVVGHQASTGLFGTNTTATAASFGDAFTVLAPGHLAPLSTPFNSVTPSGTLTVAATDPTNVTGAPLTAGPTAASALTLAFDNTASSANANLTYTLDGTGGNIITNFAKLQVQKTNAGTGSVKLALANNTRINDLSLLNSTTFDLVNHALAVEAPTSIATYLSTHALYSSSVDADPNAISTIAQLHGSDLGLTGSDTTTFLGLTLDASTLLLKPAYYGDINLDGRINPDDYALMDRSVAKSLTPNWVNGDFNADNLVNATDYFLLDRSYALTHGNALSPSLLAQRQSQFGDAYVSQLLSSIPEPTSLATLTLALPLLARRRRTHTA